MLAFAGMAPALVDTRRRRMCGEEAWARFAAATSTIPFAAASRVDWRGIGLRRPAAGLALYALLLLVHGWVIGVSALPI